MPASPFRRFLPRWACPHLVALACAGAACAAPKPDIVLIMTDDMGYSDLGCYGSEIPTPALDGLAANGLRFTRFYNTSRCCPTRASLMTGLYPHQAGVGHMVDDYGHPGYRGRLGDNTVTLAEVLREVGYQTFMAVHAAMVSLMDRATGRVLDALRETGRFDNTLVIFLSDNGASAETIQGTQGRHGSFPRGGTTPEIMPGPADTYASFGPPWANAANTPFRLYKADTYEGGTATPLIAHWPADIAARGELRHHQGHVIDIMPTLVEISGASYPTQRGESPVSPMQGVSLTPAFRDTPLPDRALFFEHQGSRAVRMGIWALIASHRQPWRLYDVTSDRTETIDLAEQNPDTVAELRSLYDSWAKASNVLPWPVRRQ